MTITKKDFVNGSFYLYEKIKSGEPFAAGKIGNCELMCVYNYLVFVNNNQRIQWSPNVIDEIYNNAGVFPQNEEARLDYVHELINCMSDFDALAWWSMFNMEFEAWFIKKYSPFCELIDLQSLEPFYFGCPWTQQLEGKKVLVISPFTKTIQKQFKIKNKIWNDHRILPDFELLTINHNHSPGIDKTSKYASWLKMIEDIKNQMDTLEYDIVLTGTGASSLPLISHAKKRKKVGIHLGGPLQLLFGIKGGRWDNGPIGKYFYNEHWVRPSPEETPLKFKNIEGGCYW